MTAATAIHTAQNLKEVMEKPFAQKIGLHLSEIRALELQSEQRGIVNTMWTVEANNCAHPRKGKRDTEVHT